MRLITEILRRRGVDDSLVEGTGIPRDRLLSLAEGADLTMAEARKLAPVLGLDLRDVIRSAPPEQIQLLFRDAQNKSDLKTVLRLERKITSALQLLPAREQAGPWWAGQFERGGLTYAEAESNAIKFRQVFCENDQIGPLFALPKLVTNRLGILLFLVKTEKMDGASAFIEGVPFIFLSERFAPRMLFTLAHELGHLVSHHDPRQNFAVLDTTAELPKAKKFVPEFYAHSFAACLLMPARGVAIALDQIRKQGKVTSPAIGDIELLLLSRIYGVSFYAAARRCEDLKLLPRGAAATLTRELTKRFRSPEKRAESAHLPPRQKIEFSRVPEPLLASAIQRLREGELSIGKVCEALELSVSDILDANAPTVH